EQEAEPDRHALGGELRDRLFDAVFEDLEGVARQAEDRVPLLVDDRRGDARDLYAGSERLVVLDRLLRRGERDRSAHRTNKEKQPREKRSHVSMLTRRVIRR